MPLVSLPVGRGTATGIDPSLTEQLQESVGVVYKVGDPAAHKFPGRAIFNATPLGTNVDDVGPIEQRLLALAGNVAYSSGVTTGSFSTTVFTLQPSTNQMDITSLNNISYVVTGNQNTSAGTGPFNAFAVRGSAGATGYRIGLTPVLNNPGAALIAGSLTGSYYYWTTEYDSTNSVESSHIDDLSGTGMSPVAQGVRITKPATRNPSADRWRIYRTISGGTKPIGWLVADVAIGTTTYDDTALADADLVLNDTYRIISPNGVPESMDGQDAQALAISSITTFEGSLVGITAAGVGYTPAGEPHSWPASYTLQMPTKYGGREICVRACGDGCYVATRQELFRLNYLPDETDNVFSTDVAIEHVANYGTPSACGMCSFTAWGGAPVLFVASLQGPILCVGKVVDRAVRNIDWTALVNTSLLSSCKAVDNPAKQRVELYYTTDTSPSTWEVLHFYYDDGRSERREGPLPEMSWTGPHPVPGPGTFVAASDSHSFTAGDQTGGAGYVYEEGIGTTDAALLVDSDGTIPFTLRTRRTYMNPTDTQSRADRVYIHCREQNAAQDYNVTFTAYRENGLSTAHPHKTIQASGNGMVSHNLNATHVSFDVTVTADGVSGMAPINNIHVRVEEPVKALKTQVV